MRPAPKVNHFWGSTQEMSATNCAKIHKSLLRYFGYKYLLHTDTTQS